MRKLAQSGETQDDYGNKAKKKTEEDLVLHTSSGPYEIQLKGTTWKHLASSS